MKKLNNYITERLKLTSRSNAYTCQPKDVYTFRKILKERLDKNKDANLNDIDVSKITDMCCLFKNLDPHNIDISEWDVSNVTDMSEMFYECENFNCDLSKWNVSNVTDMSGMFYNCVNFNANLSKWNVSNVEYMNSMFYGCKSLKNKPTWRRI